jgi:tRNA-2-methylthio-N6-dimethylallyladenosine synthase
MNRSDSERVWAVLEDMGLEWVDREEEADLIGVVACSVRQKSIDKVYAKIHRWNGWKKERPLLTFLSGCILPEDEKKFLKLFDLVFRMPELPELPEMLQQYGVVSGLQAPSVLEQLKPRDERTDFWQIAPAYASNLESFIPIQNGCDKFCTYCAVPYTRGREVSRASAEILTELEALLERGAKSITLLGQNVNSYGLDQKGSEISFAQLLDRVGALADQADYQPWIYFTSPHPRDMSREVLEVMARHKSLANQLHLPLQSGDDEVLRRMNRRYTLESFLHIVKDFRELLPEATLFTDIIVGFSGETDAQFQNTLNALEEMKCNMIYGAKYSPRPGAQSANWEDDIPPAEKSRRLALLGDLLKKTAQGWNQALVGQTLRVLIDGKDRRIPNALMGRTEGRIPVRILDAQESAIGSFQQVKIKSCASLSLEGVLLDSIS